MLAIATPPHCICERATRADPAEYSILYTNTRLDNSYGVCTDVSVHRVELSVQATKPRVSQANSINLR